MKHELELKVQAWLDGELPDAEARRIGEWVARDAEASALAAELGCMRQAIASHQAAVTLGESREFYWSKIARQIEREAGRQHAPALSWSARWRRFSAALAGMAALACVLFMAVRQFASPTFDEISATGEGMEAVTFHDQSAQMTVVWLQDNSVSAESQPSEQEIRYQDEADPVIDWE